MPRRARNLALLAGEFVGDQQDGSNRQQRMPRCNR
jgi:hypothetical protein